MAKKGNADDFIQYMRSEEEIEKDLSTAESGAASAGDRDKARKSIAKRGTEFAKSLKDIDADKSFESSNAEDYSHAMQYNQLRAGELIEDSTRIFDDKSELEKIVGKIKEDKLEGLVGNDNYRAAAGKDYAEWVSLYESRKAAKDLAERAKKGKGALSEDENKLLTQLYAAQRAEEAKKDEKERGYSEKLQNIREDAAFKAVMRGKKAVDYEAGAKRFVEEADKKLREYEAKTGKNVSNYAVTAISNLAARGPEQKEQQMKLTYELTKGK